jgi:hypothetical protein
MLPDLTQICDRTKIAIAWSPAAHAAELHTDMNDAGGEKVHVPPVAHRMPAFIP